MLLTEKQAARTWCPFQTGGRAWEHSQASQARDEGDRARLGVEQRSCIGSKCMAWRWKADPEVRPGQAPLYVATGERWSCEHCAGTGQKGGAACPDCEGDGKGTLRAAVGFCGLAGPLELLR